MGPDNLAFWKANDINATRKGPMNTSFPNPGEDGEEVHVLPDSVHLMKSTKTMLEQNQTVCLPESTVEEEHLPSPHVKYSHVDDLLQFESGHELRVAFRLKEDNVHCKKQFKKMNVGTSKAVLCHRTGIGLQMLGEEKKDPSYLTTAWFIMLLNTFFALATCRNRGLAISKANPVAYEKAIALIKKVSYIFQHMKVGKDGSFKPVQRGMDILCAGYLNLIHHFLEVRGYSYIMLGRFTGDCIENIFSLVRAAQAIPTALMFLQYLKVISLAQFSHAIRGSSYDYEESSPVSEDFLEEARKRAEERAMQKQEDSYEEYIKNPIRRLSEDDYKMLDAWEKSSVYDMAGSCLRAILKSSKVVCEKCVSAAKWQDKTTYHQAATLTQMKEFTMLRSDDGSKGDLQIYVSDAVYRAVLTADITFRLHREAAFKFRFTDMKLHLVQQLMYVWDRSGIPDCHRLPTIILDTFLNMRIKEHLKREKEDLKKQEAPQRSSKSAAMHQAANNMMVPSGQKK